MDLKDRIEFEYILKAYKKKLSGNRKASRAFLVQTGIFTTNGKLRKPYRHLREFFISH